MTACPADDELVRMVEGALGEASLAAIEAHVDGCERCAAVVGELGVAVAPARGGRRKLAGYELDRRIAMGGMGEVWAAWDAELQREVAIKLVRPEHADDPRQRARLLREARALARLAHPNVLAVYDVGEDGGEVYLATELVAGDTLASRGGPSTDWRAVARLYAQAARGLAAAHAVGLVHRDVKPANLLVGGDGRVRVADFGLAIGDGGTRGDRAVAATDGAARAAEPTQPAVTAAGHIAGTPAYMAPEQRGGGVIDARCDQFALALALVEGIDGRRPAAGIAVDGLRAWIGERRVPDAALAQMCAVIARALAVDPAARFADMAAFADAIDAVVAVVSPPDAPKRARWRIAAAIAVAAVAVIAGGVAMSARHDEPPAIVPAVPVPVPVPVPSPPSPSPGPPSPVPVPPSPVPVAVPVPPSPSPSPSPAPAPAPRPPSPSPSPRPLPPPSGRGAAGGTLADVEAAIHRRDPACAHLLDPTLHTNVAELARIHCQMVGGACDHAAAELAPLYASYGAGATVAAQSDVDLYCPPDDPATRARRLSAQTMRQLPDPAACARYVAPARALAAAATEPRDRMAAAAILAAVAHCTSAAGRCDDARALLHDAGNLVPGLDNPGELASACR